MGNNNGYRCNWIDSINQLTLQRLGGHSQDFVKKIKAEFPNFEGNYISNLENHLRCIGEHKLADKIVWGAEYDPNYD